MDSVVSLNGNDIIRVNSRILFGLATGDNAVLTVPNELFTVKTGKNGNTVICFNAQGRQAELSVRVLAGSADDAFLNDQVTQSIQDPPSYPLLVAELDKRIGDGQGNVGTVVHYLRNGVIAKQPEAKSNIEGEPEQGVVVYAIKFAEYERSVM
jgi:hypothetical protein